MRRGAVVFAASGLAAAVFLLACRAVARPMTSVQDAHTERIEVPSGSSVRSVARQLKDAGLIRSSACFYAAARFPAAALLLAGSARPFSLKSGIYQIDSSTPLAEIFAILTTGRQEYIKAVLPEGLTASKIAARLEELGVCAAADFASAVRSRELLERYQIPGDSLEGYLFPDTYFFTPAMEGAEVAACMTDNFFDRIRRIDAFSQMTPELLNKTVILASIVEREYRVDDEAPLIAGVFQNRLDGRIGLYSCATIEYIITEIEGRPHPDTITYDDLKLDSPYNTYKWAGLPPGPISNPGEVALKAAAEPAQTDYYFFRVADAESGRHHFSRTFSTHISEGYTFSTKK
ncbi:MAG: endolytic transglycosylase MltG [Treponemataceae bacterium]|nr:endolytic transglycosylase MltG [Treponemataceae bacterium]